MFGNPYAIKNFCNARVLVACYEDDAITQTTAADLLYGRLSAKGKLPVTVCESLQYGSGIVASRLLNRAPATDLGFDQEKADSLCILMLMKSLVESKKLTSMFL